mmetsp:Transcript_97655/g.178527  ORF Transcript_97655/g.178527 Transcript_97655/m.178527 type:complete len:387 (-) Transcript_97655:195-1355(-)
MGDRDYDDMGPGANATNEARKEPTQYVHKANAKADWHPSTDEVNERMQRMRRPGSIGLGADEKFLKQCTDMSSEEKVVLVFSGAFNPPTKTHAKVLELAITYLKTKNIQVAGTIVVPSSDELVKKHPLNYMYKMPFDERSELITATMRSSGPLCISKVEQYGRAHYMGTLPHFVSLMPEDGNRPKLVFICGARKVHLVMEPYEACDGVICVGEKQALDKVSKNEKFPGELGKNNLRACVTLAKELAEDDINVGVETAAVACSKNISSFNKEREEAEAAWVAHFDAAMSDENITDKEVELQSLLKQVAEIPKAFSETEAAAFVEDSGSPVQVGSVSVSTAAALFEKACASYMVPEAAKIYAQGLAKFTLPNQTALLERMQSVRQEPI